MGTTQNMGKGGRIFNVVECHFSSLGGRGGQEFSEGRKRCVPMAGPASDRRTWSKPMLRSMKMHRGHLFFSEAEQNFRGNR